MSSRDCEPDDRPVAMVRPFPQHGQRIQVAYRELHLAVSGTPEQKQAVGPASLLARPWDPSTCQDPDLRSQLWAWLDEVVLWLNHEHTWDLAGTIPTCWPHHPHLVREIAVLADQRRRAALALSSDPLEDWHRYALPAFAERMRARLKTHCEEGHQAWPGRSRHTRATSQPERRAREDTYVVDLDSLQPLDRGTRRSAAATPPPRLGLVDLDTGEIKDD